MNGKILMKKSGRYDTSALTEGQYESGSRGRVLMNLLGIKSKREMDRFETERYFLTTNKLIKKFDREHRFTAADICYMHTLWLGTIYEWAGHYRHVLMSKDNFTLAAPAFIPRLMDDFERNILSRYTPCVFDSLDEIIEAMAVVHTELVLIHPFREGN